ncbi:MAG TPA: hypothetical protein VF643_14320 [Sphingomonas sp.]
MRRGLARVAASAERCNPLQLISIDDHGARHRNPVLGLRDIAVVVGGSIIVNSSIHAACEDAGQITIGELRPAERRAAFVERFHDVATAPAHVRPIEDFLKHRGLGGDGPQFHALFLTILLRDVGFVTERDWTTVVEALTRVLPAALAGVDGRIDRLLLSDHGADRLADPLRASLAKIFGHRYDFDARVSEVIERVEENTHIPRHAS